MAKVKTHEGNDWNDAEYYETTEYYCPKCGNKTVWVEVDDDGGDFYVGLEYVCTTCPTTFCLPHLEDTTDGGYAESLAQKLKSE